MIFNYFKMALRTIQKNVASTTIQAVGLGVGLTVFIMAQVIVNYEQTYDTFFKNYDKIYSLYVDLKPDNPVGVKSLDSVNSAVQPLLAENLPDIKLSSRLLNKTLLVRVGDNVFNETMKFADPDFLEMFDIEFVSGSGNDVLDGPTSVIISEAMAAKYFGDIDPVGKTILVNNEHSLQVTGMFRDLPVNSHLMTNMIMSAKFEMVATMGALRSIFDEEPDENWDNLQSGDYTYIMMPDGMVPSDFETQFAAIFDANFSDEMRDLVANFAMRPLVDMNLYVWEATGIPGMTALRVMGLMILLIAVLNFTSLSAALGMNRMHEVGIRKSLGASPRQIFAQFLLETILITSISLLVAMMFMALLGPKLADLSGRAINFNLFNSPSTALGLILLIFVTGILSGGYPAYVISKGASGTTMQKNFGGGTKSSKTRTILIGTQFTVSIILIIGVIVTYAQNKKMQEAAFTDIKDQIVIIDRISEPAIEMQFKVLQNRWRAIPGVEYVTTSSQVPFDQSTSLMRVSPVSGDESRQLDLLHIRIGDDFAETYDLKLLAGRNLNFEYSGDSFKIDDEYKWAQPIIHVVLNEMAVTALGFDTPQESVDQLFYASGDDADNTTFRIIGVHEDVNFKGFFSELKATAYTLPENLTSRASIRVSTVDLKSTVEEIDAIWKSVLPDFPIERSFLDDGFQEIYKIFSGMSAVLVVFAVIAVIMASIGLFGLTIFMINGRTNEIGVRKVLGASANRIMKMLTWQFSKPVLVAFFIGAPLAYFAMNMYLQFFAERIELTPLFFGKVGLGVVLFTWLIVGAQTMKVALSNPSDALRYE